MCFNSMVTISSCGSICKLLGIGAIWLQSKRFSKFLKVFRSFRWGETSKKTILTCAKNASSCVAGKCVFKNAFIPFKTSANKKNV